MRRYYAVIEWHDAALKCGCRRYTAALCDDSAGIAGAEVVCEQPDWRSARRYANRMQDKHEQGLRGKV